MIIRSANIRDASNISDLIQKVTDQNPNEYSQDQIIAWKQYNTTTEIKKQLNERIIFCAFENDKLIGTIGLKENLILGFYVSYVSRKSGIGTKLLNHLEKYAVQNNIKKLELTSTPSAFNFYKKRGYKAKKSVVLYINGIAYPEMEMEKVISDKAYT